MSKDRIKALTVGAGIVSGLICVGFGSYCFGYQTCQKEDEEIFKMYEQQIKTRKTLQDMANDRIVKLKAEIYDLEHQSVE